MRWFSLLAFALSSVSFAQSITEVELSGGSPVPKEELLSEIGLFLPIDFTSFNSDTTASLISKKLNSIGYLDHKIDLSLIEKDTTSYILKIEITPGIVAVLKSLKFKVVVGSAVAGAPQNLSEESQNPSEQPKNGESLPDGKAQPQNPEAPPSKATDSLSLDFLLRGVRGISFIEGSRYNEAEIKGVFTEILDNLENKGYPFAKITVNSVITYYSHDSTELFAEINASINPEKKAVINKIEITGNTDTSPDVILREINIKTGDIYYPEKNDLITSKLNKLRFFEPVPPPEFYFTESDEGVFKISVKETTTNNFDGIIGYVPPAANENDGYITGLVNIDMRNLFGTGRNFSFKWQQLSRNSQELDLRYMEPWVFGLPLNLSPRLFQKKQDTLYVDRILELTGEYYAGENFSVALTLASQSVIPTLYEKPVFTVFNSTITTGGIGLRYDTRDDPISPTNGINFFSYFSISNKKINGPAEFIKPEQTLQVNLRRLIFDLALYYQVFNRNILAFGVHAREIQGDLIEDSDLYKLGGNASLRGYREEQFRGNRTAWSNLEYRYLLSQRSFVFAFFDSGYYLLSGNSETGAEEISAFKTGYGFGISFETGIGLLSVSYALASGESFRDGKIHFGIVNQF